MKKNFFRNSLIISLLLHLLVALCVWLQPKFLLPKPAPKKIVELELMDPDQLMKKFKAVDKNKIGQIVEQDRSVNEEVPKESKFLSKKNQQVEKETQAELKDKFRNSPTLGGVVKPQVKAGQQQAKQEPQQEPQQEKVEKKPAKQLVTNEHGVKGLPALKDLKPIFKIGPKPQQDEQAEGGSEGPSATDDHLKVANGMQTLLNTREFIYYSYYQRIKDKLRQYWEPKIKEKMERILRQGRTIASQSDRITKIVILLDNHGKLIKVQVVGASGVEDLDQAAVEAFQAAAPFPNPPHGIVEDDGLIRIRWDFILEANNSGGMGGTRIAQDR